MGLVGTAMIGYLIYYSVQVAAEPHPICDTPQHGYLCAPNISHVWGQYSPYFSVPSELDPSVPPSCTLTFAHVLSRHGARDPTLFKTIAYRGLITKIHLRTRSYGPGFEFLKNFKYTLGADQLTPFGQQQLVHSGLAFYHRYRSLALQNGTSPPFIRASGQARVIHSAEFWSKGFHTALLSDTSFSSPTPKFPYSMVIIPERLGANNTLNNKLCGSFVSGKYSHIGSNASQEYLNVFGPPILRRLIANLPGANLSLSDLPLLMDLCPYHTVASPGGASVSPFCSLFSQDEWRSYDYYQTLGKWYGFGPGNPLGPTQGVGWANELVARLTGTNVEDGTSTNRTLDGSDETFPLDRGLYADFSHDNDMVGILGALGLYEGKLDNTTRGGAWESDGFSAAWTVPFAGRVYVEKMKCDAGEELLPAPSWSSYIPFMKQSSPYGPPQPAPGGVVGWFNDKIRGIKNRNNRTAAGAYEQSGGGTGRSHRGFGPLDPDEAWDTRVGHEADAYAGPGGYYEEQELGLATPRNPGDTTYGGSSYQMNLATNPAEGAPRYEEERGRTRSRSPGLTANPFADSAEPSNISLRGVSPRPMDAQVGHGKPKSGETQAKRSSMFREDV
ncbi:hypothetical protein OQA88_13036 [Cercophora sp. LCS_1]